MNERQWLNLVSLTLSKIARLQAHADVLLAREAQRIAAPDKNEWSAVLDTLAEQVDKRQHSIETEWIEEMKRIVRDADASPPSLN